jgi:small-conductance mechanosensitive channel
MFWARDYAEQGLARSEVYEAVHDGLTAAGIEIPVPTRRLIHESESEHA